MEEKAKEQDIWGEVGKTIEGFPDSSVYGKRLDDLAEQVKSIQTVEQLMALDVGNPQDLIRTITARIVTISEYSNHERSLLGRVKGIREIHDVDDVF